MTAFELLQSTIFANGDLGEDVIYTPAGGVAFTIRTIVVEELSPELSNFSAPVPIRRFDVPFSSLAQPREGDSISWKGKSWIISSFNPNGRQSIWQVFVVAA